MRSPAFSGLPHQFQTILPISGPIDPQKASGSTSTALERVQTHGFDEKSDARLAPLQLPLKLCGSLAQQRLQMLNSLLAALLLGAQAAFTASPPAGQLVPRFLFGGELNPTKIRLQKKVGTLFLTPLLEDLVYHPKVPGVSF